MTAILPWIYLVAFRLSVLLSDYEEAGVPPPLQRIGDYEGPDHQLDDLTARQREVIKTVWGM